MSKVAAELSGYESNAISRLQEDVLMAVTVQRTRNHVLLEMYRDFIQ